ncbi:MAG: DUF7843 domain-containing protein, partial [Pseudobdellovibrionaceae bacterium]
MLISRKIFCFILLKLLFLPWAQGANSFTSMQLDEIAQIEQWKLLLHFKKYAKAGSVSEVDGGDFFLSPT